MDRSKGGYVIIDLTSLPLSTTEEATAITNPEILKQLLELHEYGLDSKNLLKPIYLRSLDSNGVEVVNLCELERNNGALRIKAFIMDSILVIYVAYDIDEETLEVLIDSASYEYVSEVNKVLANIDGEDITPKDINASGKITGNEIIENMDGYSFSAQSTPTNFTFNFTYAGVVKNGNKITFVIALEITKTGAGDDDAPIGEFNVPSSIYDKLYPVKNTWLAMDKLYVADDYNSGVDLTALLIKTSGLLRAYLYGFNNFTLNKTYYVRYEKTFLLSDNLAS